ncbi:MAG: hypothetical protein H0X47_20410 [Nitrospirales bacterium]|nr:hypothetical protein [Nitrospirales bacterium]
MPGGVEALPFGLGEVRRVRAHMPDISERQGCRVFRVARSALQRTATPKASSPEFAEAVVSQWQGLMPYDPTLWVSRLELSGV